MGHRHEETQLTPSSRGEEQVTEEVPWLTLLAHPDPSRVGERLALPLLASGREVRLARLEPVFQALRAQDARPLDERSISRQPIRLVPGADGSVTLDVTATRTAVTAGGEPVDGRRTFSPADVQRGVVLQVGRRVVLLLHRMPLHAAVDEPGFGLVGESAAVVRLRREVRRLAPLDVPVLLRGETGTGKELVARALHDAGPRHNKAFVAVNMGVLTPSLAAAELFGAVRGAYTGAERARNGFFLAEELTALRKAALGKALDDGERPWPPAELVARLARYDWPGNVRELRNVARRLAIAGRSASAEELRGLLDDAIAEPGDSGSVAPKSPPAVTSSPLSYRQSHEVREEELLEALEANRWRIRSTAKQLGISRTTLYAMIDRSPAIRRASEISAEEIAACKERHGGDVEAMAAELRVSSDGLRQRLRQLAER